MAEQGILPVLAMGPHNQRRPAYRLLDLPHLLSLEGFHASLWSLLTIQARRSLKFTCREGRLLVESLISSSTLDMGRPRGSRPDRPAWQQAVAHHCALLSRLPRLSSLTLYSCWPNEVELVNVLAQYGGSSSAGRVTRLSLHAEQLSHAGVLAVRGAFPQLAELTLAAEGTTLGAKLELQGALFLPFQDGRLTRLAMTSCSVSRSALASLAGVTTLHYLQAVQLPRDTPSRDLRLLSTLRHLRHCDIVTTHPAGLVDASALFSATGLTSLRISNLRQPLETGATPAGEVAAALALLAGLSHLQSLDLGPDFEVDSATLSALGCLPHLTRLCVGGISAAVAAAPAGAPAHLPQLQHLHLGKEHTSLSLSRLLSSLQPLLPLPSLRHIAEGALILDVGVPNEDNGGDDGLLILGISAAAAAAAAQAARLKSIASVLAAAPRLPLNPELDVSADHSHFSLTVRQIADSLTPLAGRLRTLALWSVDLDDADWGHVHGCLPGLTHLRLDNRRSHTIDLAGAVRHLPALTHLMLIFEGGEGAEAEEDAAMWLALAAECGRPLVLDVSPDIQPGIVARCRVVQEQVHGAQHINWP